MGETKLLFNSSTINLHELPATTQSFLHSRFVVSETEFELDPSTLMSHSGHFGYLVYVTAFINCKVYRNE